MNNNLSKGILFLSMSILSNGVIADAPYTKVGDNAVSWGWSRYVNGHDYVPLNGSYSERNISRSRFVSRFSFKLDEVNVQEIHKYNDKTYQKKIISCFDLYSMYRENYLRGFFTVDVKANPHKGNSERLDAIFVSTNLPRPKKDLENDFLSAGWLKEESEIVALGKVRAGKKYYVKTYWKDKREKRGTHGGGIGINFAISIKGWSDYNNCINSPITPLVNFYGGSYRSK